MDAKSPLRGSLFARFCTDLLRTEFYQDFLRPLQLASAVGVTVQQDGTRHMLVSAVYPASTAEPDGEVVGRLQRLVPHLKRVAQLNRQLAEIDIRMVAAETALNRLATAVLVVRATAQVVHLNAAAERIIKADDGLTMAKNSLAAASPSEAALLRQVVAANAPRDITARPGGVMRVSRQSGRTPYEVLVTPLAPSEPGYGFGLSAPTAAIFVRDPDTLSLSPLDCLQRLHSLTAAEARVMQALIAGDTLDAIADRTGVAKETLRNQLKAVFAKTGTSSQAQLIRLGLRGIAAFQP